MSAHEDSGADLVRIFREEAVEHLDGMVERLLAVEAGQGTQEDTDALFRHAHSIKGNAGMVGLQEAGTIANAIEDVLARAREAGALAPTLTDPLLHATDALRRAVSGERELATAAVQALTSADENGLATGASSRSTESGRPRAARQPDGGQPATGEDAAKTQPTSVEKPHSPVRSASIRVAAHKVDRMLDAVGETVVHHRRLEHALEESDRPSEEGLEREVERGERLLDELQVAILQMRTVPLSSITSPLPRAVRDLAAAEGKQVDLKISGSETQLDRVLLDGMSEAINHLLRNAVAHGIESPDARERAGKPRRGTIELHAQPRGGQVAIEVRDDGAGVAAKALAEAARRGSLVDVLAEAGFSTAESVSEIAGRGVGLDAVKRQVESVGGSLAIETEPGAGTCTTLLLPITLALLRVLIVQRGEQRFGLPLANVIEVVAVERMMTLGGRASIEVREESLALSDLAAVLAMAAPDLPEAPRALVIDTTSGRLALACDRVIGEQEIVVKPLGPMLAGVSGYLGAAVLSDGAVMLILDPAHLVRRAPRAAAAVRIDDAALKAMAAPKVLVVDDQFTVRELQRSILSASGYRVEVACDGQEALDTLNGEDAFDIVVTDLQMPEMDGLALLAAIRADPDHASLPVVVVTSRGSEEDRRRGAEAGADAYIVKDEFDQQALLQTVERLVGAR